MMRQEKKQSGVDKIKNRKINGSDGLKKKRERKVIYQFPWHTSDNYYYIAKRIN